MAIDSDSEVNLGLEFEYMVISMLIINPVFSYKTIHGRCEVRNVRDVGKQLDIFVKFYYA